MGRSHDVGLVGDQRFLVGPSYQRLGGEMENEVRLGGLYGLGHGCRVAQVGDDRCHALDDLGRIEQVGAARLRGKGVADHIGAHGL